MSNFEFLISDLFGQGAEKEVGNWGVASQERATRAHQQSEKGMSNFEFSISDLF
jgi:hypothetical protein